MKTFLLHWRGDKTEPAESIDIADAFRKAGYGRGAINALDYFEEVKQDATGSRL